MDERMVARVVGELRAVYPHDEEELLRAAATKTMRGAVIALRLACTDLGAPWNRISYAAAHVLQSGKHSDWGET